MEAQASQIGTVPGGGPDPSIGTASTLSVATISTQNLAKTALWPQVGVASVATWPSSVSRTTGYGLDPQVSMWHLVAPWTTGITTLVVIGLWT